MAHIEAAPAMAGGGTAVLVMNAGATSLLCPFFGKCDGVLLTKGVDGVSKFHTADRSGANAMCDLILELKPRHLICGFIDEPERQRLLAAGIDIRLGSCNCPVDELVASVSSLPVA